MFDQIGKALGAGGAVLASIAMVLHLYGDGEYSATYWEQFRRWDVVTLLALVAVVALAAISLMRSNQGVEAALALVCAAMVGNFGYYLVDVGKFWAAGGFVLGFCSLVFAAAAVLLTLPRVGAPMATAPPFDPVGATPTTAPPSPVAPPPPAAPAAPPRPSAPAPPGPPAGWYADPAGAGGQRYWDGAAWTQHTEPQA